jgi:hypothetical protein
MSALASLLSSVPVFDRETETSCGTSVAEAREALAFWRGRLARLPWYRRTARAEARTMTTRWRYRLVRAQLERWRLGALMPVAAPLLTALTRVRTQHLWWLWRLYRHRARVAVALAVAVAATAVMALGALTLFVVLAARLL